MILQAATPAAPRAGTPGQKPAPGAYCPLPEAGQKPVCLSPAEAEYQAFFAAVDRGSIAEADTAALEADLSAGGESAQAYLALSSISYGYWRLATELASAPDADPALRERLRHWNELLLTAYGQSESDPHFRDAVRMAALDLQRHTPGHGTRCRPGETCEHADSLVSALAAFDSNAGLRTPLEQLMQRLWNDSETDAPLTRPASDRP
jgi:hypothetical protein